MVRTSAYTPMTAWIFSANIRINNNPFVQRLPSVFQTPWTFGTRWVVVVQTSMVHWERSLFKISITFRCVSSQGLSFFCLTLLSKSTIHSHTELLKTQVSPSFSPLIQEICCYLSQTSLGFVRTAVTCAIL